MKLLLTSGGITNELIAKTLFDLVGKKPEDIYKRNVKGMSEKICALDDNSALRVVDGKVEVISRGKWFMIN